MSINKYDSLDYRKFNFKSELDKAINSLEGILTGVSIDKKIDSSEVDEILHWCSLHKPYINRHPYNELISLLEQTTADGIISEEEYKDVLWLCQKLKTSNEYYDLLTCDIQKLQGILHGILADGEITENEIRELKDWLDENEHLAKTFPYDEVYSLIMSVLKDGILNPEEQDMLKVFFSEYIDLKSSYNINRPEIEELKLKIKISGICSVCPEISIENNLFCFTGVSQKTTRSKIVEVIESLGGNYNNSLIKNTNYLIIGDNGNPCWAFACYGRKVEKAIQLRKNGEKIIIIHENDFWGIPFRICHVGK